MAARADSLERASSVSPSLRAACTWSAGHDDGVLLYGSQARGTATPISDIDVLLLRDARPGSWANGNVNVTSYRPEHLAEMARLGSLFVLHLRTDGVLLADPTGRLAQALAQYRSPGSYAPLVEQLSAAGQALAPAVDSRDLEAALLRLGDYLVRTAAYAMLAQSGRPAFDPDRVGTLLGEPAVAAVLESRGDLRPGLGRLDLCRVALERLLGFPVVNSYGSVEALAVMLAGEPEHGHAAALLGQVLAGQGLDYSALTPPPL